MTARMARSALESLNTAGLQCGRFPFSLGSNKELVDADDKLLATAAHKGMKKFTRGLQQIVEVVDEGFSLGESSRFKPSLWKYGGHPQLLNAKELNMQEREILNICRSLWESADQEEGKQPFCTDVELRRHGRLKYEFMAEAQKHAQKCRCNSESLPFYHLARSRV